MASTFDPRQQTFTIKAPNGSDVTVSLEAIEAQRVRLANISINYGVQLGLCLLTLIVVLMLLPTSRLRRPLNSIQLAAVVVSVVRLALLVLYFPGPLAGYLVAWTHDASVLGAADYATMVVSNGFGAVQFALIEVALVLQSWALVRTWPLASAWQLPAVLCLSVLIAVATVVVKTLWVVHYSRAVRGSVLPIPLDAVGKAAVVLGAVSIFYFEGIFVAHVSSHLRATRGVLRRGPRRGLTSLEILAIGNGILMLLPSLFAGLDIAAGPGNTKVLPFDAGSWVQTLVVNGLPLIGLVAFYRGSEARARDRRVSLFFANNNNDDDDDPLRGSSKGRESTTLRGGSGGDDDTTIISHASRTAAGSFVCLADGD
ncbi:fungal pheromone mating factor STE2 GPCR-domain-containing protein [Xylariaceae sp. FL1651]|nr:fungal pheromone mating factor STE2 GPCR-domain-containing protein [Xylariaceae sp. FL1651]